MMRLNPEGYLRFVQADKFEATYAGGEANVAVSLSNYGIEAAFVSKVPAHGRNNGAAVFRGGQHIFKLCPPKEHLPRQ